MDPHYRKKYIKRPSKTRHILCYWTHTKSTFFICIFLFLLLFYCMKSRLYDRNRYWYYLSREWSWNPHANAVFQPQKALSQMFDWVWKHLWIRYKSHQIMLKSLKIHIFVENECIGNKWIEVNLDKAVKEI